MKKPLFMIPSRIPLIMLGSFLMYPLCVQLGVVGAGVPKSNSKLDGTLDHRYYSHAHTYMDPNDPKDNGGDFGNKSSR